MKKTSNTVYVFTILAILSACSSKPTKTANAETDGPIYDTENPTTYAEYKKWRSENDPASEAYAEYKEWETNYRIWKAIQEQ